MPRTISPMLATLATHPPSGDQWLYEVKWDGVRAIVFVEDNQLRILSRSGKRCEQQYPELTVLPHFLKASNAILDGEIAVLDENGRSSFNLIQPRISVTDPNSIAHLARSNPVTLFLFDLLYLDGYDLRGVALEERKQLLEKILTPADHIRFSGSFRRQWRHDARSRARQRPGRNPGQTALQQVRRPPQPGLAEDQSQTGARSSLLEGSRTASAITSARWCWDFMTTANWCMPDKWAPGFNDKSLQDIYSRIEPLIIKKSPFSGTVKALRDVTWLKPELVAEIKFLEFTPDGLLRAPVFIALRSDKDPKDCVRETARKGGAGDGCARARSPALHHQARASDSG